MADVGHELAAIRFVVDSPLKSKVAKFNQVVNEHKSNQLENPFSGSHDSRSRSPKLLLKPEEYGKPKPGSLTEFRGMKANIQVYQELIELCGIIHQEGKPIEDEPELREITFGELFQIYVHVNDKVAGLLLRARKHELLTFEGEMLFQKFHDDVPIYLLRPFQRIQEIMTEKQSELRRSISPAPSNGSDTK
ncbi:CLUMA_CG003773, isoform A [Clunio marinus]|uniref:CLUMA_CG003773, isoform A n=1 Tax=Clunio marinus TaxID=568069 RepID=A0A1J1HRN5_9DIPT|nr:CLUMA_CG003773, isoform A [Clunio marinus]